MALLEARHLRKTYRLGRRNVVEALRGVDVAIAAGEMVAVMGPSGSGKSTLLHLLGMLHGPDLDGGPRPELIFAGRDVTAISDLARTRLRGREIGYVFQAFNLIPTLTAIENVFLACGYAGVDTDSGRRAANDALAAVGLVDRAHHRPAELSGGEQQRVAIARALVNRPQLVLADEPTGNLDSERSAEIVALLAGLNREHGQAFLLVTHEPEVAAACGRVIRMRDGIVASIETAPAPTLPPSGFALPPFDSGSEVAPAVVASMAGLTTV